MSLSKEVFITKIERDPQRQLFKNILKLEIHEISAQLGIKLNEVLPLVFSQIGQQQMGKSTFLNYFFKTKFIQGDGSQKTTEDIRCVAADFGENRVIITDSEGFDSAEDQDLSELYAKKSAVFNMAFCDVLFFHLKYSKISTGSNYSTLISFIENYLKHGLSKQQISSQNKLLNKLNILICVRDCEDLRDRLSYNQYLKEAEEAIIKELNSLFKNIQTSQKIENNRRIEDFVNFRYQLVPNLEDEEDQGSIIICRQFLHENLEFYIKNRKENCLNFESKITILNKTIECLNKSVIEFSYQDIIFEEFRNQIDKKYKNNFEKNIEQCEESCQKLMTDVKSCALDGEDEIKVKIDQEFQIQQSSILKNLQQQKEELERAVITQFQTDEQQKLILIIEEKYKFWSYLMKKTTFTSKKDVKQYLQLCLNEQKQKIQLEKYKQESEEKKQEIYQNHQIEMNEIKKQLQEASEKEKLIYIQRIKDLESKQQEYQNAQNKADDAFLIEHNQELQKINKMKLANANIREGLQLFRNFSQIIRTGMDLYQLKNQVQNFLPGLLFTGHQIDIDTISGIQDFKIGDQGKKGKKGAEGKNGEERKKGEEGKKGKKGK